MTFDFFCYFKRSVPAAFESIPRMVQGVSGLLGPNLQDGMYEQNGKGPGNRQRREYSVSRFLILIFKYPFLSNCHVDAVHVMT